MAVAQFQIPKLSIVEYTCRMPDDDVLLIEVRDGRLYAPATDSQIGRADIAVMIAIGRKYIVRDPETGQDVTRQIHRYV